MTITQEPTTTMLTTTTLSTAPCCPKCGVDLELPPLHETQASLLDAQKKIEDLQSQVRLLNQKAAAAVDKWADYEDELEKLRAAMNKKDKEAEEKGKAKEEDDNTGFKRWSFSLSPPPPTVNEPARPTTPSFASGAATRISAMLSRKPTPNLETPPGSAGHHPSFSTSNLQTPKTPFFTPGHSPAPSTGDLLEALSREQQLRLAAEATLNETSREVEDLSVTLFEQANEMVATERRARARLEERVGELEKRDTDKRARLDRLEQAMIRIERVRTLLGQDAGGETTSKRESSSSV